MRKDKESIVEKLFLASESGRVSRVKEILDKGTDINSKDFDKSTLLHQAITRRDLEMIKFLLDKGIDLNARNRNDDTPLHLAARRGYPEIVELLLKNKNTDVNVVNVEGETALHDSLSTIHYDKIAPLLIAHGANVNVRRKDDGWMPIHIAAYTGAVGAYKLLLKNGANSNIPSIEFKKFDENYGEVITYKSLTAKELYKQLSSEKIKEFEAAEREVETKRKADRSESLLTVGSKRKRRPDFAETVENSRNPRVEKGADDSSPEKLSVNSQRGIGERWVASEVRRRKLNGEFGNSADNKEEQK
ncbi:hypothetical protein NF27_GF00010, partial [Candidatus Jidaibacter acanthamoeba]